MRVNRPHQPAMPFPPFAKGGQGGFSHLSLTTPAQNPPHSPFCKGGSHGAPLPRQINPIRTLT
jgi:hypothetical protein